MTELDPDALTKAHLAIEDVLIERRDARMFIIAATGLVVNEANGEESQVMWLSTRSALEIGVKAYLEAIGAPR